MIPLFSACIISPLRISQESYRHGNIQQYCSTLISMSICLCVRMCMYFACFACFFFEQTAGGLLHQHLPPAPPACCLRSVITPGLIYSVHHSNTLLPHNIQHPISGSRADGRLPQLLMCESQTCPDWTFQL